MPPQGIRRAITGQADGTTRFGALAVGLGSVSEEYRFELPPYIVLLVRTFLTLEGIATVRVPHGEGARGVSSEMKKLRIVKLRFGTWW